jgi:hypothetical protein
MKKLLGCFLLVTLLVFGMSASAIAITMQSHYRHTGSCGNLDGVTDFNCQKLFNFNELNIPLGESFWNRSNNCDGGPHVSQRHASCITSPPDGWSGYGWSECFNHCKPDGPCNNAPVPEPATILLLGSGLIGLAGFGRKKFKK